MNDFSILFGGKAGDGIDRAGLIIGRIFNRLGYRIYIYRDYPSVIRGGHTFSIIRACENKIAAHKSKVDFILALNQESLDLHKDRLKKGCLFIYDSEQVNPVRELRPLTACADGGIKPPSAWKLVDHRLKSVVFSNGVKSDIGPGCGIGLALGKILKEENAPVLMRNTCLIGALCKAVGIKRDILEGVLRKEIPREIELNLKVAQRGYNESKELINIGLLSAPPLPVLNGNEAIGLGLIKGGLNAYVAYPMTPTSGVLHYLAASANDFSLKVIHPESEIGAALMALGFAYAGDRVAVGTSGGGFCLMVEALSLSGMAELPVVFIVGQRPGPSTGLPTYTAQTELHFVLNAGQGEFPRFITAPGDLEEAYYWSVVSLNMAWKYQMPAIILSDKTLSEGSYNLDLKSIDDIKEEMPLLWDRKGAYKRYLNSKQGVSPLAFPPDKEAIIKVNSYEHDEYGVTTESPDLTVAMQDKRLSKEKYLAQELDKYAQVKVYGDNNSETAILCWGSNKGVCVEAAENLGFKVIQPVVLWPFPTKQLQASLNKVKKLICVENNATAQLARLLKAEGFRVDEQALKYDGRPFSVDELEERLKVIVLKG